MCEMSEVQHCPWDIHGLGQPHGLTLVAGFSLGKFIQPTLQDIGHLHDEGRSLLHRQGTPSSNMKQNMMKGEY